MDLCMYRHVYALITLQFLNHKTEESTVFLSFTVNKSPLKLSKIIFLVSLFHQLKLSPLPSEALGPGHS